MSGHSTVLTLSCADRPGIVAAVANHLFEHGQTITEAQQFNDAETGGFFMRVSFKPVPGAPVVIASRTDTPAETPAHETPAHVKPAHEKPAHETPAQWFLPIAERFAMTWTMASEFARPRVMLLVSKFDHCLADLLYRWRLGELRTDITGIIANNERSTFH